MKRKNKGNEKRRSIKIDTRKVEEERKEKIIQTDKAFKS